LADERQRDLDDPQTGERLLFAVYLLLIVVGLALFIYAGATHR
jgi:hypothetical protein